MTFDELRNRIMARIKQVHADEIEGKTIAKVAFDDTYCGLGLLFTDQTCIGFIAEQDDFDAPEIIVRHDLSNPITEFGSRLHPSWGICRSLDLITQDDADEIMKFELERQHKAHEEQERQEYERLKAKFGE